MSPSLKQSPLRVLGMVALGSLLSALVALLDWVTGADIPMGVLYLAPGALVAWRAGKWVGLGSGALSGLAWLVVELGWHRVGVHPAARWVNFFIEIATIEGTVLLVAALAERAAALRSEVGIRRQAQAELAALNQTLEKRVDERSATAELRAAELARSEASLRAEKELSQSILTCMAEAVIVADPEGCVRLCNAAASRLFRLPPDAIHPIDAAGPGALTVAALFSDLSGGPDPAPPPGRPLDSEEVLLELAHEPARWLSLTSRPIVDGHGAPRGSVYVLTDISARKQLDGLATEVSEREQQRIGQDLHDGLGQHLVGLGFAVALLRTQLQQKGDPLAARAEEVGALIDGAITQVRNLARVLYPVRLQEGLPAALEELADHVRRTTSVRCSLEADDALTVPDGSVAAELYRVAQEAVNNALKHGRPSQVSLRLETPGGKVRLTVVNDGQTFQPPPAHAPGIGLQIMRYRARRISADLHIGPGPQGGTVVVCFAPNPRLAPPPPTPL